jgi:hypothetical protein
MARRKRLTCTNWSLKPSMCRAAARIRLAQRGYLTT